LKNMYEEREIKISKRYLQEVITAVKEPVVILGGWATYFLVNDRYKETTGRTYIGSRDIDIGFHMEEQTDLTNTNFAPSYYMLTKRMGFRPLGFRLFKETHVDTGEELSSDRAKNLPSYMIFTVYVDMVVDMITSRFKEYFGFTPIDEPLLTSVFDDENNRVEVKEFGRRLWLPVPELLLSMKIKSCLNRAKEHKRIKDICDIAVLLLFSTEDLNKVTGQIKKILNQEIITGFNSELSNQDIRAVADIIGIDVSVIKNVLSKI